MFYLSIFAPDGKSCGRASINYPLGQSCKLFEMRRVPAAQIVAFIGVITNPIHRMIVFKFKIQGLKRGSKERA